MRQSERERETLHHSINVGSLGFAAELQTNSCGRRNDVHHQFNVIARAVVYMDWACV